MMGKIEPTFEDQKLEELEEGVNEKLQISTDPSQDQLREDARKETKDLSYWHKFLLTTTYMSSFTMFGFALGIIGPTISDLKNNTNSSVNEIGYLFTTRGLGFLMSSMYTGYIMDKLSRLRHPWFWNHLYMALNLVIFTASICAVPFTSHVWVLFALFFVGGLTVGSPSVGCNANTLSLWKEKSTSYMLFLHFTFGVGAILAPLLRSLLHYRLIYLITAAGFLLSAIYMILVQSAYTARSILRPRNNNNNNNNLQQQHLTNGTADLHQNSASTTKSSTYYRLDTPKNASIIESNQTLQEKRRNFRISCLTGITLLFNSGFEVTFNTLLYSYIVNMKISSSPEEASLMNSMYWVTYTGGRLGSSLLSRVVPQWVILLSSLVSALFGSFILYTFYKIYVLAWIGIILLGFGCSTLYPSTISFPNACMNLSISAKNTSLIMFIGAIGTTFIPLGMTQLVSRYGFRNMMAAAVCVNTVSIILVSSLVLWADSIRREKCIKKDLSGEISLPSDEIEIPVSDTETIKQASE